MNQFDKSPEGKEPRPNIQRLEIKEREVQEYVSLLEQASTHEERVKIVKVAMLDAASRVAVASNNKVVEDIKMIADFVSEDTDLMSKALIKDSAISLSSEQLKKKVDQLRSELGLPPKFS